MRIGYRLFPGGDKVLVLDFTTPEQPDDVAELDRVITSHRQTSSSRRPGKLIEGEVKRTARASRKLEPCPRCGGYRWSDDEPHALRWNADATGKVDCVGRPHMSDSAGTGRFWAPS